MKNFFLPVMAIAISLPALNAAEPAVATFDDLGLGSNDAWYHAEVTDTTQENVYGSFVSGGYEFNNVYTPAWGSWGFWSYASKKATTYADYTTDQWNSATGGGFESEAYGVLCESAFMGANIVKNTSGNAQPIAGMLATNSAWVVASILNGDGMSPAFDSGDWFKVTATGTQADGSKKTVDFYLADYRDGKKWHALTWQWIDLSGLGAVTQVEFTFDSSKKNDWGITTPAYMCVDNFGGAKPAGIDDATMDLANRPTIYYDLQGRQVATPQHGIFIARQGNSARKIRL